MIESLVCLEKIEDIFRPSLREIKSSSLTDSNFVSHRYYDLVNRETSLQIEASTNKFACNGTRKELVFHLELPASHTYR